MARGDAAHGRTHRRAWLFVVLALVLVAGGLVAWRLDVYDEHVAPRVEEWFGDEEEAPVEPADIAPPPGLELPPVAAPAPVAKAAAAGRLDPAALREVLDPLLADRDLGRVAAAVVPLRGGAPAYATGTTAIPASTTKVVTSAAALLALGPDHVFETAVVSGGRGRIVLVGGGDPFLGREPAGADTPYPARTDIVTLARRTADALREQGRRRVRLGYDDSLFTGPAVNPTWEPGYVPTGEASPTTALWLDQGRSPTGYGRVADPSLDAATTFAAALQREGITVVGAPQRGVAGSGGAAVASVSSAPLASIVERVLDVSDDDAAEVLLRHVGQAVAGDASIEGGRRGRVQVLQRNGVSLGRSVLHDGSGLSRANRLDPRALVAVLQLAASPDRPELRPLLTGLPVAGFTGSLTYRFDGPSPEARGRVRAKTGTLTGVHSLAGLAVGPDGVPMLFALMTDRVRLNNNTEAQVAIDDAAAALGACRCGA